MNYKPLFIIMTIGYIFLGFFYIKEIVKPECETMPEYDYMIDLSQDSCNYVIYITDEYGHMNVINPDSLEEFIEKDNL